MICRVTGIGKFDRLASCSTATDNAQLPLTVCHQVDEQLSFHGGVPGHDYKSIRCGMND
jgi:hypothetical protein